MRLKARGRALAAASLSRCERFGHPAQGACYRWLGKILAVLTDGEFARAGCPRLTGAAAQRECAFGASQMDEALVTFS
jgi:hypothetical protein